MVVPMFRIAGLKNRLLFQYDALMSLGFIFYKASIYGATGAYTPRHQMVVALSENFNACNTTCNRIVRHIY